MGNDNQNYWSLGDIRLRSAQLSDAGLFSEHFESSPERTERAFDRINFPRGEFIAEKWLSNYIYASNSVNDDRCVFIIEDSQNACFLGYIDVWETDIRNGIFKTGVKMLEGKAGKGYATLAFTRVLEFYFNELRYQKCAIYVYDFNDASHHFHKKLGFVEEGRLRREYYSNGKYYDSVCYGLTIEEFNSRR